MAVSETLFDPVRQEWVAATPEEHVRQSLIGQMIDQLGFPLSLIAVEKSLRQLPHLTNPSKQRSNRRADIICFGKEIHPEHALYPLLLVECKAVPLTPSVIKQVTGYNHHVGAYFVAVANATAIQTGWWDHEKRGYQFIDGLPKYADLLAAIKRHVSVL